MADFEALSHASAHNPEQFAKSSAQLINSGAKLVYDILPLTWAPEMITAIKQAESAKELALYVGVSALLLGLDAMDLYPPARAGTAAFKEAIENAVKKAVKRGLSEKAAHEAVTELVTAVAKNTKVARESFEAASKEYVDFTKNFFITKDKSELYRALQGEVDNAAEILREALNIADVGALERGIPNIGVGVFDKGKTWLLNSISRELGDVGIAIYLKSIYKNAEKFGVDLVMTGGDEILVIARDGGADTIKNFYDAALKDMADEIKVMRKESGNPQAFKLIEDALSSVSIHADSATLKVVDGKVKLASPHKKGEPVEFHDLSTFLSRMEARELFAKIPGSAGAREILREFMHLSGEALPTLAKSDGVVVVRLGFGPETKQALTILGEYAEKGVAQAIRHKGVGPSILNLLGHPVADYFSREYANALKIAFKEAGYAVEVGQAGAPLSISYVIKGGKKAGADELEKITKRANDIFVESVNGKNAEIGLRGVSAFAAGTKETAEGLAKKHFTRGLLNGIKEEGVRLELAYLHTDKGAKRELAEKVRGYLEDTFGTAFVSNVPDAAYNAFENLPAWVRQPEDLVTYLRDVHFSDGEIISILKYLEGVPL
ncbi:MAG: hypothetical protein QXU54_02975 [Candidatus Micrarchaeia archaeon]